MDEIGNILTKGGHEVTSIEWVGDPEKQRDIFIRLGEDLLTIGLAANASGLPPEERERLSEERTKQALKELEEAGIECEMLPVFGTWPLSEGSQD